MTNPAIKCSTFDDMISICEARGRIEGTVETVDRLLIKGFLNEHYMRIGTERNWWWRSFHRTIAFKTPEESVVDVSSAAIVDESREVVMTGPTVSASYVGKSIRFNGGGDLYRIIGYEVATNKFLLEGEYLGTADTEASYKIYQYEFALPPDYDTVKQLYIMDDTVRNYGQIDYLSTLEFNRKLAASSTMVASPAFYTVDGKIRANTSLEVLDKMVLDYDFLGGDDADTVDCVRILPINPDKGRLIHIDYSMNIAPLEDDDAQPMMPVDSRWMLVHFALYEWFKLNGQAQSSEKELRDATSMLKEMRNEHRKTEPKAKFVVSGNRFRRVHNYDSRDDMFRAARALEYDS